MSQLWSREPSLMLIDNDGPVAPPVALFIGAMALTSTMYMPTGWVTMSRGRGPRCREGRTGKHSKIERVNTLCYRAKKEN